MVYYKRKKSGEHNEKDYYTWERPFLEKKVTWQDVLDNQSDILMDLNFYQFGELIDIRPKGGSHFIHSMSEPFSEEDIEDEVMHNWLNHFHMNFHQLHASGHMNKNELVERISRVKPKRVFPIHTENPSLFRKYFNNAKIVEAERDYKI